MYLNSQTLEKGFCFYKNFSDSGEMTCWYIVTQHLMETRAILASGFCNPIT